MADPLSISAGVVGLAGFALSSIQQTMSLVQGVKGAPSSVNALTAELNTLENVLKSLTEVINNNEFGTQDRRISLLKLLQEPLQQCVLCSHGISEKLKPYIRTDGAAQTSTWRGLSWFLNEREFLEQRRHLATQKAALDIAVSVVNLSNISDVKKQITGLMRRLAVDDESVRDSAFGGSSVQGSDEGYAIRRFLLETESVIDDSPPGSLLLEAPDETQLSLSDNVPEARQNQNMPALHTEDSSPIVTRQRQDHPSQRPVGIHQSVSFPKEDSIPPQNHSIENTNKVFGVSLQQLYLRDGSIVPLFVLRCIEFIEKYGLEVEGIYNVPANRNALNMIKKTIDRDGTQASWPGRVEGRQGLLCIADTLKLFLRELPDDLLNSTIRNELLDTIGTKDLFGQIYQIRAAMPRLGELRYATLRAIALHLRRISDYSTKNLMTAKNIAAAFGPTLIGGSHSTSTILKLTCQIEVNGLLIEYAHEIFAEEYRLEIVE